MSLFQLAETIHGKLGHELFVATPLPRFGKDEFKELLVIARNLDGSYSDLRGGDKIPGFQFKTRATRSEFLIRAKAMALSSVPAYERNRSSVYAEGGFWARERPLVVARTRAAARS